VNIAGYVGQNQIKILEVIMGITIHWNEKEEYKKEQGGVDPQKRELILDIFKDAARLRNLEVKERKERGVCFSSTLSKYRTETSEDDTKEVFIKEYDEKDKAYPERYDSVAERKIDLLKDDKFFNGSPWDYNIIRT
jgi:hypothetical protein